MINLTIRWEWLQQERVLSEWWNYSCLDFCSSHGASLQQSFVWANTYGGYLAEPDLSIESIRFNLSNVSNVQVAKREESPPK